jgi:Oxidoreductase molybdopterin binding domain
MRRRNFIVSVLVWIVFSAYAYAGPGPDVIAVGGTVDKPGDWTAARLKSDLAADVKSISYTSHGQKHTSSAVPLLSLLKAAGIQTDLKMGPKVDPKTKNYPLRLIVIVQGHDGYTAGFSLAELLPEFGDKEAWLALDADGGPLTESDGPARLIIPSDVKPGRWVHGVGLITVLDGSVAATQPAAEQH